jgi:hypothetical protein
VELLLYVSILQIVAVTGVDTEEISFNPREFYLTCVCNERKLCNAQFHYLIFS